MTSTTTTNKIDGLERTDKDSPIPEAMTYGRFDLGVCHGITAEGGRRRVRAPSGPEATLETSLEVEKFVRRGESRGLVSSSTSRLLEPTAAAASEPANFTNGAQRGASQGHFRFGQGHPGDVIDLEENEGETRSDRGSSQRKTYGDFCRAVEAGRGASSRAGDLASYGRQALIIPLAWDFQI